MKPRTKALCDQGLGHSAFDSLRDGHTHVHTHVTMTLPRDREARKLGNVNSTEYKMLLETRML